MEIYHQDWDYSRKMVFPISVRHEEEEAKVEPFLASFHCPFHCHDWFGRHTRFATG